MTKGRPECPEYPDYDWIKSPKENKLKIKISKADFEKIRSELDQNWKKEEKLLKIRLRLGQSEQILAAVKQHERTFFLGLFSVE